MADKDTQKEDILRRTALFQELDDGAVCELAAQFVDVSVPKEEVLFVEDDPTDAFYVIREGAVILVRDQVGRPMQLIGRLGPGDCCGVTGLFAAAKRSTSAKAVEDSRVLKIEKDVFLRFLDLHPAFALEVRMKASERHQVYAAAALDLGRRSEVRIRIDRSARVEVVGNGVDSRVDFQTRVDNVSNGGLCLTSLPEDREEDWQVGNEDEFRIHIRGAAPLEVRGRVAWMREGRVGIAFLGGSMEPQLQIQRLLQELLILK